MFNHVYRQCFAPDFPLAEMTAHEFLKSIYNIVIERGWLRLRSQWSDNVLEFWRAGEAVYNVRLEAHRYVMW
jgi:hypothetical protein